MECVFEWIVNRLGLKGLLLQRLRFGLPIILSAFLLFLIQPLIGKSLIPKFGGAISFWSACLAFFQLCLLCGYIYSHLLTKLNSKVGVAVHAVLCFVTLWWLPISVESEVAFSESNYGWQAFVELWKAIGPPFLLLSSTSPLIQFWMAKEDPNRSPYRLFAVSNLASVVALLAFPFAFEPFLSTRVLLVVWAVLFVGYIASVLLCGSLHFRFAGELRKAKEESETKTHHKSSGPSLRRVFLWIALSAAPSMLLLATNHQISSAGPALSVVLVLPLFSYLLTFVLCFDNERLYVRWVAFAGGGVFVCVGIALLLIGFRLGLIAQIGLYCAVLFVLSFLCHGELVKSKPPVKQLTLFYLCVAMGGCIGSFFVSFVAPILFVDYFEFHCGLTLCFSFAAFAVISEDFSDWMKDSVRRTAILPGLVLFSFASGYVLFDLAMKSYPSNLLSQRRDFFGVVKVIESDNQELKMIVHNRIMHGFEHREGNRFLERVGYYHDGCGLEHLLPAKGDGKKIGCIGLGSGALLSWTRKNDETTLIEISPAVIEAAESDFRRLPSAASNSKVILGDGRIELAKILAERGEGSLDVLIIDAFSGDTVPSHLITREAIEVYMNVVSDRGVVGFHITNRYLDLAPVIAAAANEKNAATFLCQSGPIEVADKLRIEQVRWVFCVRGELVKEFESKSELQKVEAEKRNLWTDDFSRLFNALK